GADRSAESARRAPGFLTRVEIRPPLRASVPGSAGAEQRAAGRTIHERRPRWERADRPRRAPGARLRPRGRAGSEALLVAVAVTRPHKRHGGLTPAVSRPTFG